MLLFLLNSCDILKLTSNSLDYNVSVDTIHSLSYQRRLSNTIPVMVIVITLTAKPIWHFLHCISVTVGVALNVG